ncbi:MAG: hypothetical protein V7K48_27570 [Nostoc sp.]|uniref:hypothetical protein n=1 Tax=Nostoc sp. TaxID=1180 RepID=UPI002FF94E69
MNFAEAIKTHQAKLISDLEVSFSSLPSGIWQRSLHQVIAVPIALSGQTGKADILVVGLNPFRLFDDNNISDIYLLLINPAKNSSDSGWFLPFFCKLNCC